ncbi:hypothetical protein Spla01_02321 [Streptomyces platensis]|uniref:Cysteine dioxygenase type I n=2 Tax=Streptomyces platensis TaxID=58346 RepID=A0ABX3XYA7_STRPT|nr:hypothetical protein BG653_03117 [Streptomyces platensis]
MLFRASGSAQEPYAARGFGEGEAEMQVEEARRLLVEGLGAGPEPPSPEAARQVTAELAHPGTLGPLVRRLSVGDLELAECVRLSYRHVLGFDKLLLLPGAPRFMLRIHFWHGAAGAVSEDIHNHRCAIASAVVRGRVRMECYEPAADGVPAVAYRETIDGPGGAWRLRRVGEARLRLLHTEQYGAGRSYGLAARTLHRVVSEEPTVTLFLETAPQRSVTDVYVRSRSRVRDCGSDRGDRGSVRDSGGDAGPTGGTGRSGGTGRTGEVRYAGEARSTDEVRSGGAERADPPPKTPLPPAVYLAELGALAASLGY